MGLLDSHRARKLHNVAMLYASKGWPVIPLDHEGIPLRVEPVLSADEASRVWADHGYDIGITTAKFDVLMVMSPYGAGIYQSLLTKAPTAKAPQHGNRPGRWYFYLERGALSGPIEKDYARLYTGQYEWVPAPPSSVPEIGPVNWLVPPSRVRWTPYRREDIFDALGLT